MADIALPRSSEQTIRPVVLNPHGTLPDVFRSIHLPSGKSWWKRFAAFAGPGFMISVGYMDPGNWGTDLSGGSKFGMALMWVILLSSLLAMFLQTLCARLGIATGKDLAQCCRDYFPKPVVISLWLMAEVAIIACDLAEVIGSAVALNLLFGIPVLWGVLITSFDVLMLMGAMKFGFRKLEAIVIALVATIAICFLVEVFMSHPNWGAVGLGTIKPTLPNAEALFISLGILGATVMPHNLYLHSSIVQTRATGKDDKSKAQAIKYNTLDTLFALGCAFFVNAAIYIVAASVFGKHGYHNVEELQDAHRMLTPLLGGAASTIFAVALLASGQSSTITGTLAGQVVMEGFVDLKVKPWVRRLVTRGLAIIPAAAIVAVNGGHGTVGLLVISQVILSLQLPFAVLPLIAFTSDKKKMGQFANSRGWAIVGYTVGIVITGLNLYLLYTTVGQAWFVGLISALGVAGGVIVVASRKRPLTQMA